MTFPTREQLEKRRGIVIADAQMKLECADWHGCANACMDLREIDAQLEVIAAFMDPLNQKAPLRLHGWSDGPLDQDLEGAILPNGDLVGKRVI